MDTHDWDIVCACSAPKLNGILAEQFAATPASLHYEDDAGYTIDAQFAPWRLGDSKAGKRLRIELPITTGKLTTPLAAADLGGVVCEVDVDLAFVKDPSGTRSDLRFDLSVPATEDDDDTPGAVRVNNPDKTDALKANKGRDELRMALHDLLPKSLIANKAKLEYVFTTLDLTPSQDAPWLLPAHADYAWVQGGADSPGYLAIFTLLASSAVPGDLEPVIDPSLCDGKSDVCVAFSKAIFLEHIIKPTLPAAYPGTTEANFKVDADGITGTGPIQLGAVRSGLIDYHPWLSSVRITVRGSVFGAKAAGRFDITGLAGAYVDFSVSTSATLSFDAGSGQVKMTPSGKAKTDHNTHIPCWEYAIAVVSLVEGVVVAAVVTTVVDVVIKTVTDNVATAVDDHNEAGSGGIPLSDWAALSIRWPGVDRWTVQGVTLSDALVLDCALTGKG